MKKLILAACLAMLWVMPAAAAQGPYVGASAGLSVVHDSDVEAPGFGSGDIEYDAGFGFNLVGGFNFDQFRVEGEFGYKTADVDKVFGPGGSIGIGGSDITVLSFMANGYYDIKMGGPVMPFVGAGLGLINGDVGNVDDTVFGYQLTAGVTTAINKNLNLDVYYRYQGAASDFEEEVVDISYGSSNFFAGMRYNF